jgi:hypothetical protein
LPLSFYRNFWKDSPSREVIVDVEALRQVESYLIKLGVSYAKDEKSIMVDKHHHEAYSCGISTWLLFTLDREL